MKGVYLLIDDNSTSTLDILYLLLSTALDSTVRPDAISASQPGDQPKPKLRNSADIPPSFWIGELFTTQLTFSDRQATAHLNFRSIV